MIALIDRFKIKVMRVMLLSALVFMHTSFAPHPVHLSEAEAHWKKDRKVLEVSVKLFYNDLEQALSEQENAPIYLCPDSANYHKEVVRKYFEECFKLAVNKKNKRFEFLGYECENEVVYVYLEYSGIKKIKSVSLENTLLFDSFSDQTNLVHLHIKGKSNTLLTKPKSHTARLEL